MTMARGLFMRLNMSIAITSQPRAKFVWLSKEIT